MAPTSKPRSSTTSPISQGGSHAWRVHVKRFAFHPEPGGASLLKFDLSMRRIDFFNSVKHMRSRFALTGSCKKSTLTACPGRNDFLGGSHDSDERNGGFVREGLGMF